MTSDHKLTMALQAAHTLQTTCDVGYKKCHDRKWQRHKWDTHICTTTKCWHNLAACHQWHCDQWHTRQSLLTLTHNSHRQSPTSRIMSLYCTSLVSNRCTSSNQTPQTQPFLEIPPRWQHSVLVLGLCDIWWRRQWPRRRRRRCRHSWTCLSRLSGCCCHVRL